MDILSSALEFWPLLFILFALWVGAIFLATKWEWFREQKDVIKTSTEILAVLVAAIWVYQTFIYNEWIKPNLQPPHVVLESSAEVVGKKDDFYILQLKTTLTNSSKVKVNLLSYWVDIHTYSIASAKDKKIFTTNVISDLNSDKPILRNIYARDYIQSTKPELAQIQQLFSGDWWLEPGEDISAERTVYLSDKNDVAQINYYARTAKNKDKLCIKWGVNDPKGSVPSEIGPLTHLNTGGEEMCGDKEGFEKFNHENKKHLALRDKYALSTTSSRLEIPLMLSNGVAH